MISRRTFLEMLAVAGGAAALRGSISSAEAAAEMMYDPPRFGNLSLLQIGDTHAQLLPTFYRETSFYPGLNDEENRPPFLTGEFFLEYYGILPDTLKAHAHSALNFPNLAELYGRTGGYAHLATAVKRLRSSRPDSLLLDCGDSFQGSGTALWTRAADMVQATRLLGVDAMTGDDEFSLGSERLKEIFSKELHGQTAFLAHNVQSDSGFVAPVRPYAIYFVGGVPVGVIGQTSPHVRQFDAKAVLGDWRFGIDEERLQLTVDSVRARGAKLIVLLSHAGLAVDLKLASRIRGIDVIFTGQSHDALPEPLVVKSGTARTLVSSVGAYGKFCGVLDLDVRNGRLREHSFRLIPIFSNMVPADPAMTELITKVRAPFMQQLDVKLADNEALLYRRGAFFSSFDQLILDAMMATSDVDVAFTPGVRWGTTILPNEAVTVERLLEQMVLLDAGVSVELMSGKAIRENLETWLDEVFNRDPYLRSGEDMVRVGGMTYRADLKAARGGRIKEIRLRGKVLSETANYRTASWGMNGSSSTASKAFWPLFADYLRQLGTVRNIAVVRPVIDGLAGNRGVFETD